ncbi:unnamed protein product [marine sediment metagenome]|uniref:Uncharacterized protein n=1 Tax=marine sediment metagenome TaxID=412755 RepID=X1AZM9_9ZZZZ
MSAKSFNGKPQASAASFNPKPEAPAVSGRQPRVETTVACGSGLNEGFISDPVLNDSYAMS